jgi:Tfp pilus assembly protein PilN
MIYKINLLPDELHKVKKVSNKQLAIKVSIVSLIAIIIISQVIFGTFLGTLKYKTSKAEKEIVEMQPTVIQVDALTKSNEDLNKKIGIFTALNTKDVSWADLLENIAEIMNDNVWLTRINIEDDKSLTIEGNADKLSTLGTFMAGIRSINTFNNVTLTSAKSSLGGVQFILKVERGV